MGLSDNILFIESPAIKYFLSVASLNRSYLAPNEMFNLLYFLSNCVYKELFIRLF